MNFYTIRLYIILIASVILFAFIARTAYLYNLPAVAVVNVAPGNIRHHKIAPGTVVRVSGHMCYAVFTLHDIDFVEIGSEVRLNIRNMRNIIGLVEYIRLDSSYKEVSVSFEAPDIQAGDDIEAVFEHFSEL